ncbi:MAG TPA: AAA family ATPase [Bryobacteraceae bacterium]|nr:AAA family ATPase [Bryobacteraceae bacterium]
MIRRLYVHNFRCLENFELSLAGQSSVLLIGKNGSGKTSVGSALEILQRIARGTNRVDDLVKPKDFARGRMDVPLRFEIEIELEGKICTYTVALELLKADRRFRVAEEKVQVGGDAAYTRETGRVYQQIDLQLFALPILQQKSPNDPIFLLRRWLARMLILRPVPQLISGESKGETLEPEPQVTDFGAWFSGLVSNAPSVYSEIDQYLKQVMPDLKDIKNPLVGTDARSLTVQFSNEQGSLIVPFEDLSDGEKCYTICALVLAANKEYGPVFCFWDEPDNYLALSEVGNFVMALRKAFQAGGQLVATSHNPEVIRRFSDESTLVLYRSNHLEPTRVRPLKDIQVSGDLVGAIIRDDVVP